MTMAELEAKDAALRQQIHDDNIAHVEAQIADRREQHGRTDSLERRLAELRGEQS